MFRNYIKVAIRNIMRHPTYAVINIVGLSIGIVFSLLLLLYILDETTYDKFHTKAERIYRVAADVKVQNTEVNVPTTMAPLGPAIAEEYPEIENFLRISAHSEVLFISNEDEYYEDDIYTVDSSFFSIFDFELAIGDPKKCLAEPNSLVITETLSKKYFGEEDPIGKIIKTGGSETARIITGVMKEPPSNSHLTPNGLISYSSLPSLSKEDWGSLNDYTYLLLQEGLNKSEVDPMLNHMLEKYVKPMFEEFKAEAVFYLQPVTDIHLYSHLHGEISPNGDISYIYIFAAIAIFMLLIASINYMNLATARSTNRSKEVGIRKAMGSYRIQLMWQFLAESIVITFIAVVISSILVFFLLPLFNELSDKSISLNFLSDPVVVIGLLGIILFVGIVGGSYPSFFLSHFRPSEVLKGKGIANSGSPKLRKVLVVTQFSISLIMVICTWVVFDQLNFVSNKNLGFNKDQVVKIPLNGAEVQKKYDVIRNKLLSDPRVEAVASGNSTPGGANLSMSGIQVESEDGEMMDKVFQNIRVDNEYFNTLDIPIVEGRNFSDNIVNDTARSIIVNEEMVKHMGWENPIGKKFQIIDGKHEGKPSIVVGVVRNYHILPLQEPIAPLIVHNDLNNQNMLVRIKTKDIKETIADIELIWGDIIPNRPFEYTFIEQEFSKQYEAEQRRGEVFGVFSIFTILISCLGLFGLASFTAESRRKEIGIRKVVGAGIPSIVFMMSIEFLKLVLISVLIAFPVSYVIMNQWLDEFAYRTDISPVSFVLSALLTVLIAFLTVSYHSISSATSNPSTSLRE
ncbi:MAG: ABC transporter permease [Cyclobacteriaceae bacterium]